MSVVNRSLSFPPEEVFEVLIDPDTYPSWLAGCQEIRAIDPSWPEPGSRFHHRIGPLPFLTLHDETELLDVDRPHRLALEVRFYPIGRGRVVFELESATADGEVRTHLRFEEHPLGRVATLAPLFHPLTLGRNQLSAGRLERYVRDHRSPLRR